MATRVGRQITADALYGSSGPVALTENAIGVPAIAVAAPPGAPAAAFAMPATGLAILEPGFWRTPAAGVIWWLALAMIGRRVVGSLARD